jgi:hypothetical protein
MPPPPIPKRCSCIGSRTVAPQLPWIRSDLHPGSARISAALGFVWFFARTSAHRSEPLPEAAPTNARKLLPDAIGDAFASCAGRSPDGFCLTDGRKIAILRLLGSIGLLNGSCALAVPGAGLCDCASKTRRDFCGSRVRLVTATASFPPGGADRDVRSSLGLSMGPSESVPATPRPDRAARALPDRACLRRMGGPARGRRLTSMAGRYAAGALRVCDASMRHPDRFSGHPDRFSRHPTHFCAAVRRRAPAMRLSRTSTKPASAPRHAPFPRRDRGQIDLPTGRPRSWREPRTRRAFGRAQFSRP